MLPRLAQSASLSLTHTVAPVDVALRLPLDAENANA